ncbi:hypothetical protein PVAR5_4383 [Paecilomyces variotii No. 5]|uniref:Transcription factor domain-containing protein n=1 Tax=Byssochlamys spectabilis (strain No. 5 / NBRC 109023) TaxID=1356009 RepID=V5G4D0_BYSSN|nr:hypothetical protein PVAR5_4383 [Paecilomyces variotii No. 5]
MVDPPSVASRYRGTDEDFISGLSSGIHKSGISSIDGPSIPNLAIVSSLRNSEREIFYSTYWEDRCLPSLHPTFQKVSHLIREFAILNEAVLSLSACNMSRSNAEQRSLSPVSFMGAFSPDLTHQTRSEFYYSSAIKRFVQLNARDIQSKQLIIFIVLVLFALLESARGNFEAFYCHVRGLTTLMGGKLSYPNHDPIVNGLLTALMQMQYWIWWARVYFSSLDVQLEPYPIVLPGGLARCGDNLYERRVAVLGILHESHQLHSRALLQHWNHDSQSTGIDLPRYSKLLEEEGKKLDKWVSGLPSSDQPLRYSSLEDDYGLDTLTKAELFQSHEAALNYAYYIIARITQCTGSLCLLSNHSQNAIRHDHEEQYWVRRLLGVAKGMDMKTCIARNTYTIGISGLLMAALLRCQDQHLGLWIEGWLLTLENIHPTEEGSFPVYQLSTVARAVNQQRLMGRDVFGVSLPVDDGGGSPKLRYYNSQLISALLIHGRHRASGELYTDYVALGV